MLPELSRLFHSLCGRFKVGEDIDRSQSCDRLKQVNHLWSIIDFADEDKLAFWASRRFDHQ